jgi:hypothetical protein
MRPHLRPSPLTCFFLVATLAVIGCAPADAPQADSGVDLESRQIPFDADAHVAAWIALWATYDLDKVDELFLADPPPTYFSSEKEGLIVGLDAIREHHAGFGFVPGGSPPAADLWLEEVHTTVFETAAAVNAMWYFGDRTAAAAGDYSGAQKGPMTALFVFDGDSYKIAHMHFAEHAPAGGAETEGG